MGSAKARHRRRRRRAVAQARERADRAHYLAWLELHPYGHEGFYLSPGVWVTRGYPGPPRRP